MTGFILSIYTYLSKHRLLGWGIFFICTVGLICSLTTMHYSEDISEFLPLDEKNRSALEVYQQVSGAGKIIALVSCDDKVSGNGENSTPARIAEGVDLLTTYIESSDTTGFIKSVISRIDMENMMEIADEVYAGIPYFLTPEDYERIDSLLKTPGYIDRRVRDDREKLLFPAGNLMTENISRDPLGLFTDVLPRLASATVGMQYETYDGYILTPDEKHGLVILESSFGANESEHNAELTSFLSEAAESVNSALPGLNISYVGGPVIAVGNAKRIKQDSILAIVIAGILIVALLIYVFRSIRNILLILISVAWGWLFAMGIIALFYDSISVIVIGIASIILGIAVNYPLHLLDHMKSTPDIRTCLKEIVAPLAVGNITTVGAFLCLVPLNATALHDLGLFSSLLLIGTIIFVLIFLPHVVKKRKSTTQFYQHSEHYTVPSDNRLSDVKISDYTETMGESRNFISRIADINIENNRWIIYSVFILTCIFAVFAIRTEFDSDIRNINYISPDQREDMEYLASLISSDGDTNADVRSEHSEQVFIVSRGESFDKAVERMEPIIPVLKEMENDNRISLTNHVIDFLHSSENQKKRLQKWEDFISSNPDLIRELQRAGTDAGFSHDAFEEFENIISTDYSPKSPDSFGILNSSVFSVNHLSDSDNNRESFIISLYTSPDSLDEVMQILNTAIAENNTDLSYVVDKSDPDSLFTFDVKGLNASLSNTLSDDFNYIGIACSLIVFIFLWISLGSIELAIISFIPMAISWIWILGIMSICGIKFNIVNIILATFIFGQGDDYTIFMTEGLTYEFAYRKKMLASFKNSIIISALIMFIGIGTLVIADHPAMKSLGEVTVVGMLSVVLMAYFFPPFIFNILVRNRKGLIRETPITIIGILRRLFNHSSADKGSYSIQGAEEGTDGNKTKIADISEKEWFNLVMGKYLYKGREIEVRAKQNLRYIRKNDIINSIHPSTEILLKGDKKSQGELALLIALKYPQAKVYCYLPDSEQRDLLKGCCTDFVSNIVVLSPDETEINI